MDQMNEEGPLTVVDKGIEDKSPVVSPVNGNINFASFMDQMNEENDHTISEKSKLQTPQVEKIIQEELKEHNDVFLKIDQKNILSGAFGKIDEENKE